MKITANRNLRREKSRDVWTGGKRGKSGCHVAHSCSFLLSDVILRFSLKKPFITTKALKPEEILPLNNRFNSSCLTFLKLTKLLVVKNRISKNTLESNERPHFFTKVMIVSSNFNLNYKSIYLLNI